MQLRCPPLKKSSPGFNVWVGRLLIHMNMAKTWVWSDQTNDGKHQKNYFLSFHTFQRPKWIYIKKKQVMTTAFSLIVGPFKISIGFKHND